MLVIFTSSWSVLLAYQNLHFLKKLSSNEKITPKLLVKRVTNKTKHDGEQCQ